jgi:hypothetical protein
VGWSSFSDLSRAELGRWLFCINGKAHGRSATRPPARSMCLTINVAARVHRGAIDSDPCYRPSTPSHRGGRQGTRGTVQNSPCRRATDPRSRSIRRVGTHYQAPVYRREGLYVSTHSLRRDALCTQCRLARERRRRCRKTTPLVSRSLHHPLAPNGNVVTFPSRSSAELLPDPLTM